MSTATDSDASSRVHSLYTLIRHCAPHIFEENYPASILQLKFENESDLASSSTAFSRSKTTANATAYSTEIKTWCGLDKKFVDEKNSKLKLSVY